MIRETALSRLSGRVDAALALRWTALMAALAGVGLSVYLSYTRIRGIPVYCEGAGDCHAVQSSQYATLAGVPVPFLGLALYAMLAIVIALTLLRPLLLGEAGILAQFGLSLSGFLYSGYLTWLELYRIHAICVWCVISAALLTFIFVLSAFTLFTREPDEQLE